MTYAEALVYAVAFALVSCKEPPPPKLRQWYPIDRCNDYADALHGTTRECIGCIGTKCEVSVVADWSHRVDIIKLDCSGRKCLVR